MDKEFLRARVIEKFHSSTGDCSGDLCHWSQNPRLPCPRSKLLRAREWHLGLRWASDDLTSLLKAARGPPSMCRPAGCFLHCECGATRISPCSMSAGRKSPHQHSNPSDCPVTTRSLSFFPSASALVELWLCEASLWITRVPQ